MYNFKLRDGSFEALSCRVWLVRAQVPVAGLNSSQLVRASLPPHSRRPSWEWSWRSCTRLAVTRQEVAVAGRNTSADW